MSDEFEDDELDLNDASFDEFDTKEQATLGDLWRNNPMVKVGVIVAAAIAILGIIVIFGGQEAPLDPSYIPPGPDVSAPPGTDDLSPVYREAVQEESDARIEEAYRTGGSALPTPLETPVGRLEIPDQEQQTADPLQRWRQMQEERLQRELQQTRTIESPPPTNIVDRSETVQALASLMAQQMQAILESHSAPKLVQSRQITDPEFLNNLAQQELLQAQAMQQAQDAAIAADPGIVLLPAGEVLYGQLITEANSDVPAAILAQIVSGPLAGSRIIGSLQVQEELITLTFTTLVYKGESLPINAIALDPDTTLAGMATDVDRRYFRRIVLPAAAAFIEGAASAISQSGRTSISVSGDTVAEESKEATEKQQIASGIEEAGQEIRDILTEIANNTKTLVRIESGTPLGIMFLEPVVQQRQQVNQQYNLPASLTPGSTN